MAKQIGGILLKGTIGEVNFYVQDGEPLARMSGGGFNGEAIRNGKNMARVRETCSEFTACSKVNKEFKKSIAPFLAGHKDGKLHQRLMKLFLTIRDCDHSSERGKRSVFHGISSTSGKQLLEHFIFTPQRPAILPCPYIFDWESRSLKVHDFRADETGFPEEADAMEVRVGLIRFDFEALAYQQVFAAPMIIAPDFKEDSFEILFDTIPEGNGILFSVARVSFYQMVHGKGCLLAGGDVFGLEVLSVWDTVEARNPA
ncbi:hypothetical protein [Chryseobacterium sp. MDT2-18]|uniref:hypothetical protein n=1 Tax=Chryseobacterium sp. MDT2-18 TaxID=1259136 RepID=UPI0027897B09|nr:hypothetical protein [Chryseobacterium sp. MDT2-18]MDQ0476709.1 hypothetical protein [Chryseobacterium sp. MDT2-18]